MPRTKQIVYLDNERQILDKILTTVGAYSGSIDEYKILNEHFKRGGGIQDTTYFYDNIQRICNFRYGRGCELIYTYCRNVLKGRLPKPVEKKFFDFTDKGLWGNHNSSKVAYKYAKYVVRGRLEPELERGCSNYHYAEFLHSKKINIDDLLINNSGLAWYFYKYKSIISEDVHNAMIAKNMIGDHYSKVYFKQRKIDDKLIKNRLLSLDPNLTVYEVLRKIG
jgi:hypothetical protein